MKRIAALTGKAANIPEEITADETIPPYCGSITCVGHSFAEGSTPYIPILEAIPSN